MKKPRSIAGRGSVGIEAVVLLIPVSALLAFAGWKGMNRFDGLTLVRHRERVNTYRMRPSKTSSVRPPREAMMRAHSRQTRTQRQR